LSRTSYYPKGAGHTLERFIVNKLVSSIMLLSYMAFGPAPANAATNHPQHRTAQPVVAEVLVSAHNVYWVRPGDTLSLIAARTLGNAGAWPALWWANHRTVKNPNRISVGQQLSIPDSANATHWVVRTANALIAPAPAKAKTHSVVYRSADNDGDNDSDDSGASHVSHVSHSSAPAPVSATTYTGGSAFQQCVIQRESGGNPSAVNPYSGAGGLYGFLPSTWQALGFPGLPENASVAMQNAAFAKEYALAGAAPWAPYDGC
jgi:resuscitation-promoting factor RpfC